MKTNPVYILNTSIKQFKKGTQLSLHSSGECLFLTGVGGGKFYIPLNDSKVTKVFLSGTTEKEKDEEMKKLQKLGLDVTCVEKITTTKVAEEEFEKEEKEEGIDKDGFAIHMVVEDFALKINVEYFNSHFFYRMRELLFSNETKVGDEVIYISPITGELKYITLSNRDSDRHATASGFVLPASYDAKQILLHLAELSICYKLKPSSEELSETVGNFLIQTGRVTDENVEDVMNFMQSEISKNLKN